MPTVVYKLAQFFYLTPRRIQQLVKEEMPRGARGRLDGDFVTHPQKVLVNVSPGRSYWGIQATLPRTSFLNFDVDEPDSEMPKLRTLERRPPERGCQPLL